MVMGHRVLSKKNGLETLKLYFSGAIFSERDVLTSVFYRFEESKLCLVQLGRSLPRLVAALCWEGQSSLPFCLLLSRTKS